MSEPNLNEFYEKEGKAAGFRVGNPLIGLEMSVVPGGMDHKKSIEVAFIDPKTSEFLEVCVFGPNVLEADTSDPDFWTEFKERYGEKFKHLTNVDRDDLEKTVFPDLVEQREKVDKEIYGKSS